MHRHKILLPTENEKDYTRRNKIIREFFQRRIRRVKTICSQYNLSNAPMQEKDKLKLFTLEPRRKLALCRNAKHGSTTLSNVFLQLYSNRSNFDQDTAQCNLTEHEVGL